MSCSRHSSSLFWTLFVCSAIWICLLSLSSQVTQAGAAAEANGSASRLVASPRDCPGLNDAGLPERAQERAMRCLVNFARRRAGRTPLLALADLGRSARLKSRDILRCDDFDHEACGRDFSHWIERVGYLDGACAAAENIALGTGAYATPRAIFHAWLGSPGHRRTILGPYADFGVGLQVGRLAGDRGVHVWTQHFGTPC